MAPPTRTGFGARLIEQGLRNELGAEVALDYAPGGLVFSLAAPMSDALREAEG